MSGCSFLSRNHAFAALDGKLTLGTLAIAGDNAGINPRVTETLYVILTWAETSVHAINLLNTLRSLSFSFLNWFRGARTKRLDGHLAWLLWWCIYVQDRESVAVRQVNVTSCDNTVRDWTHIILPDANYWSMTP